MRPRLALPLAFALVAATVLAGCSHQAETDGGRLQIVLLIPTDTPRWGFVHVYATVTNITLEDTENQKFDVKPTRRNVDLIADATVFDGRVREGAYDNFDIWIATDMRGVLGDGTEVPIRTEPFWNEEEGWGKHRVHQEPGQEVIVIDGESLRFDIRSDLAKSGEDFVWK